MYQNETEAVGIIQKRASQMPITITEIQEVLKKKSKNSLRISKAKVQEDRLRLHCESAIVNNDFSSAVNGFYKFVERILPNDKFLMFKALMFAPIPTVSLTERIFKALEKIFDGRNPVFDYQFLSDEDAEDWEDYRNKIMKGVERWKTEGFEEMKCSINSIVIVDLKEEQEGESPEPYFYFLPIDLVVDFATNNSASKFEWIIFKQSDDRLAVFDDESYRVFNTKESSLNEIETIPLVDNPHDLGYCPAKFFWTTPISYKAPEIKRSPISNVLSKLDMVLFFEISNEHLNVYARFPVYSVFAADCDYEHQENGEWCESGFLKTNSGYALIDTGGPKPCPVCSSRRLDGAGSLIEIDPPSEANNNADLRNPVTASNIPKDSLDYNNEDLRNRRDDIYNSITGFQGLPVNNQAINEKQVIAIFESLEGALKAPQKNFEIAMTWVDETVCRLRYGNTFVSASISLGTEHYIMTPSQILEMYESAKGMSFSISTLDLLEGKYYDTEFRNNPEQLQRQRIINNLDHFRHKSDKDISDMFAANRIGYDDYMVKTNLSSFIQRFERENILITEFGKGISFNKKIENIYNELVSYAQEMKPADVVETIIE